MPSTRTRVAALLVTGLAAGIVGAASLAGAAIPDPSGSITACYSKSVTDKGGASPLQLVDTAHASCPRGFTALKWSEKGIPGPQGPQGAPGPQGVPGPQGPAASLHVEHVVGPTVTIPTGHPDLAFADCPAGEVALGGGYTASSALTKATVYLRVAENHPNGTSGWLINIYNDIGSDVEVQAHVECVHI